jgi:hypothetical protein
VNILIWGLHGVEDSDFGLLGYDILLYGRGLPCSI